LRPGCADFPPDHVAATGYRELRQDDDGVLLRRETRPHEPGAPAPLPIRSAEVCLVTGGVAGITARAAVALAERTGCRLVFLGRSSADDPAVVAGLRQLPADARYLSCDVTDSAAVSAAVSAAAETGPVRGLLHGAGVNEPGRLAGVAEDSLSATLAPKVDGQRHLLTALGDQLRMVVAFGSIIGRRGLAGQSEYCVANDWMRRDLEDWAERHPDIRCHHIEWSVWSEIGMGVRLDVLTSLSREGVAPIRPDDGAAMLLDLLADADAPVTVLVSGRFPAGATLAVSGPDVPPLRFAEHVRTRTPGVESVVEAELTPGADRSLDDHRVDGVPVLPAVLGLEAMAQASRVADVEPATWDFHDVRLDAPVIVPAGDRRTIQVAALAEHGTVRLALRDDSDHFSTDRFTARLDMSEVDDKVTARTAPRPPAPPEAAVRPHPWYGPLMFHAGRFRRLIGYQDLSAFHMSAWITAGDDTSWFSEYLPSELLLGDPGAHDAAIHALMPCVPHRVVLPVGVERLTVLRRPTGRLFVRAAERAHTDSEYVFDVDVDELDGTPVVRWRGLRLRAVGPRQWPGPLPARLLAPLVSRRLIECGATGSVELRSDAGHGLLANGNKDLGVYCQYGNGSLEPSDLDTAEAVADRLGAEPEAGAARISAMRSALRALHDGPEQRLRIEQVADDGVVLAAAGADRAAALRVRTDLADTPVTVGLAWSTEGRR
jgi:enediyne polyketide synthase